ncbi:acyl--CoA ligase [Caldibacillus lycopersici]|uniref:Acyl--CoA ligase n=1 Tax=Perspicuibacillus lycopersici TaxID=1325689 RepID=A0AAE3LL53_9BACI|nr:acyl--CoA ligase [Perspicuibacillus lycopersici]MCU9611980.1 acyl--CoA ligase [Perspicuibacillus lycopersici]
MNIQELIAPDDYNLTEEIEKHYSEKLALKFVDKDENRVEVSYKQLIDKANQFANGLKQLGLVKGDRIMVVVPRSIEAYMIYLACLKAGYVVIPGSEMLRAHDILYRMNDGEVKAVVAYASFCSEINKIVEQSLFLKHMIAFGEKISGWLDFDQLIEGQSTSFPKADTKKEDMAFISYTSGTTGQPKGVVHVHGWAYAHIRTAASRWLNINSSDTVWATAAPGWQKWVWSPFLSILGMGATAFVYQGKFVPKKYLTLLQNERINVLCCTPTEYRLMAKESDLENYDLSKLHSAVSAGEALNREVIDTFRNYFNLNVRDGYGQTESTLLVGTVKDMEIRPGSMGKPIMPEFMEIVDEEGNPVSAGVIGNIAIRKDFPALFSHYYKDPERTKNAFCGNYFVTGDRAYKDEDQYFWFQGRSDDMIISSGYTIGPFEVEDALMKHEAVKECAVVASPDPIRGNVVKAFVVLKDGVNGAADLVKELQKHVKTLTAPYKYPRIIEFVSLLPKTDSGKIRRVELRKI